MNAPSSHSVAVRLRIDDACSAFETAFGSDPTARIEPFVPVDEDQDRALILSELIQTERECRQANGEEAGVGEYLARFPDDTATVRAAFADAPLQPGDRLGKYVIVEKLGAGGMGIVYRATDEVVGRPVALKVLSPKFIAADARERLIAEARSVGRLSHPNVVTLYEASGAEGPYYLAMEYLAGGSAANRLDAGGRFNWREAVTVIADVCRGLSAAHAAGVVHLDIKPANILLIAPADDDSVRTSTAKVSDFGLAQHINEGRENGWITGTPRYMAPEQLEGRPTDARTDVYGAGAALFALLTGGPPGSKDARAVSQNDRPPDPRAAAPDVPASVARIVSRALQSSPDARYQSINELLSALEAALSEQPRSSRRTRVVLAVAVLLVCGVVVRQAVTWSRVPSDFVASDPRPLPVEPGGDTPPAQPGSSGRPVPPAPSAPSAPGKWEPLFDGKTLAGWEPRPAPVENLESLRFAGHERIFTVAQIDGGSAICATPNGHWLLTTHRAFENYQLRLEYRWGDPIAGRRNSGVMYHYQSVPLGGNVAKVTAHEFDIWPPEIGRLHSSRNVFLELDQGGTPERWFLGERPSPAWNRLDLLCLGDRAVHVVNGKVAVSYKNARIVSTGSNLVPYISGRIQLQSYSGQIYFRNVQVRSISTLSDELYK